MCVDRSCRMRNFLHFRVVRAGARTTIALGQREKPAVNTQTLTYYVYIYIYLYTYIFKHILCIQYVYILISILFWFTFSLSFFFIFFSFFSVVRVYNRSQAAKFFLYFLKHTCRCISVYCICRYVCWVDR